MNRFTQFMLVIAALLVAQMAIIAQTGTGRLVGSVAGIDGAVIPGATVVVTDNATAKEVTATTNGEGAFNFNILDFGSYTVKVTAKGFKTTTTTIKIEAGQQYSLPVIVEVGDVTENVTVTAGADVINSSNAELTSTISNRQITELPLAARNPLSLILTQAGSASNPAQGTSINGGRTASTNITRDGVNINDNFIRSNATDFSPARPSVDNVEEFTLSSQGAADSGFGSAQITFVTPRGGNEFHGAAWEYNRNSHFGANSWFNNAAGNYGPSDALVLSGAKAVGDAKSPRPFRNRNQYGFKASGRIIPNKLFFFVYGEKLNDLVTSSKLVTVLTPTARQGIFRYTVGGTTYSANLFTPGGFTPSATTGNAVPTAINPVVASQILAALPAGNSTETGDLLNTMGYRFSQHNDQKRDGLTGRIDYDVNSTNNINAVVDYQFEGNLRGDLDTVNIIPLVNQPAKNVIYSGGWRWSPTASISNEFRIGRLYSQPVFLSSVARPEFTTIALNGTSALFTNPDPLNGTAIFRDQGRTVKTTNVQDTLSWLRGNHAFRFGAQWQKVKLNVFNDAGNRPVYAFGLSANGPVIQANTLATNACGNPATCPITNTALPSALYAVLGGVLSSGSQTFNPTSPTSGFVAGATSLGLFNYSMFAPYVQDQWKVSPTFTLNFGLRWDYQQPLESENKLFFEPIVNGDPVKATLDPAGGYQVIGGNAGHAGWFYKADKNNWAPNIGFAWAPKFESGFLKSLTGEDFVLRGGFRRSYVNDELVTAPRNALIGNAGFGSTNANAIICVGAAPCTNTTAIDDRLGSPHQSTLSAPAFLATRSYTTNNTAALASNTGTVFTVDPGLQTPNQNDYTIGIQRRFGKWVGEARYVGGYSKNMLRTIDYNQITIPDQYRADFNVVRANVLAGCGSAAACAAGTVLFTTMVGSGGVTATNALGTLVKQGQLAELIWQQLQLGNIPNPNTIAGAPGSLRSQFLPNPNTGVANVLLNGGHYNYNALQLEMRRRFSDGLYMQANYTFSKELTDAVGTGQTRVEPFLDNNNRGLDYTRADYDQTHVFNMNAIYELPFGKNKRWMNGNKFTDYVFGGWQLGLVWRLASGAPMTITDGRGTLNRSGRSARQTALTVLSDKQLHDAVGIFKTRCGTYWINPAYININHQALEAGNCGALTSGLSTQTYLGSTAAATAVGGAASSGFGTSPWGNQVFFNNGPGQTSGFRRAVFNAPWYSSADLSILKNFRFGERLNFQIRGEMYNFLNTPYFSPAQFGTSFDINNSNFGKVTSTAVGARVVQFAGRFSW